MGSCSGQRSRPQQQQQQQAGRPGPVQGSEACSKAGRGLSSSCQTQAEAQSRQGHGERPHAMQRFAQVGRPGAPKQRRSFVGK